MHDFAELINLCAESTLSNLEEINKRTSELLQTSGATILIKSLQMIRLQKVILVVGMFSIFEAHLQDRLNSSKGFIKVKKILDNEGEQEIKEQFEDLYCAINALKHGYGQSYNVLAKKSQKLPFNFKEVVEGDVSEIMTLIEVDDQFVRHCVKVIGDVSRVVQQSKLKTQT